MPSGRGFRVMWTTCCVDECAEKDEDADGGPAAEECATVDLPETSAGMHWGRARGVVWAMIHA